MAFVKATVFGANGFIGSRLVQHLSTHGIDCTAIGRGDESWKTSELGHVFYCVGLTADFRSRPLDAIDAHVGYLSSILRHGGFASLLYLSSTRVYLGATATTEGTPLTVNPTRPDDLYNLSKLLGEAACLSMNNPAVRVARLSNVYGLGMGDVNFLGSIVRDAIIAKRIALNTVLSSEKDYVSINHAAAALADIALHGRQRIYNVAAGNNTTHREIVDALVTLTGCTVDVANDAPHAVFPKIDTTALHELLPMNSSNVVTDLPDLVADMRDRSHAQKLNS